MRMSSISVENIYKKIKDGKKEGGFQITKKAWTLFRDKFDIEEVEDGFLISLKSGEDEVLNESNCSILYDKMVADKMRFSFYKNRSVTNEMKDPLSENNKQTEESNV